MKTKFPVLGAICALLGFLIFLAMHSPQGSPSVPPVTAGLSQPERLLPGEVLPAPATAGLVTRVCEQLQPAEPVAGRDALAAGTLLRVNVEPDISFVAEFEQGRSANLVLSTPEGEEFQLDMQRVYRNRVSWSFSGSLAGMPFSSFFGTVCQDAMLLDVRTGRPGEDWLLKRSPAGTHELRKMNWAVIPTCSAAQPPTARSARHAADHADADSPGPVAPPGPGTAPVARDNGAQIDVMIVYTQAALTQAGGLAALTASIDQAITQSNQSMQDSLISTSFRLVHTAATNYTEVDGDVDLETLAGRNDGFMDEVHGLRNTYSADIVSLWSYGDYAGIGYLLPSMNVNFEFLAFNVCNVDYAAPNYTFSHECGHNLGCNHDIDNAGGTPIFTDAYGWRFTGRSTRLWRTIMAYPSGTRIPYFSNPAVQYDATPTGVTGRANNARVINQTRVPAANWRELVPETVDPPEIGVTNLPQPVQFAINAGANDVWTWRLLEPAAWITTVEARSQVGQQVFTYSVAANADVTDRSAVFVISLNGTDYTHRVTQSGSALAASPAFHNVGAAGDLKYFNLNSQLAWSWSAGLDADWILAPTEPVNQFGTQTFAYTVTPNTTGADRSAVVTIQEVGGSQIQHFITQEAGGLAAEPTSFQIPVAGGAGSFVVDTALAWTWTSSAGWLQVTEASPQSGEQTFSYTAGPNPGARRTAVITLRTTGFETTHTVVQEPAGLADLHSYAGTGSAGPTVITPGEPMSVSAQVWNLGGQPSAATQIRFYLSQDTLITAADRLIGTLSVPVLAAGASTVVSSTSLIVPAGLTPGNYYAGWITDPDNLAAESNEDNNIGYVAVPLAVNPAAVISTITQTLAGSQSRWSSGDSENLTGISLTTPQGVSSGAVDAAGVLLMSPAPSLSILRAPSSAGPLETEGAAGALNVSRSITLVAGRHATDEEVVVSNPSATVQAVEFQIMDDYGYDALTRIHGSSSGDAAVTTADRWFVLSDSETAVGLSGPPAMMVSWRSSGLPSGLTVETAPAAGADTLILGAGTVNVAAGGEFRIVIRREIADTAQELLQSGLPLPPAVVAPAFAIGEISLSGPDLVLSFQSVAGASHRIVTSTTLQPGSWTAVTGHESISGDGTVVTRTLQGMAAGPASRRWFRVEIP